MRRVLPGQRALAASVIGLYKTEVIRRRGKGRRLKAVECATLALIELERVLGLTVEEHDERGAALQKRTTEIVHA